VLRSGEFFGGTAVERVADLVNIAGEIRESEEDQIYSYEDGFKNECLTVGACFLTVYLIFVICGNLDRSKEG